jgi:hypothetical protein
MRDNVIDLNSVINLDDVTGIDEAESDINNAHAICLCSKEDTIPVLLRDRWGNKERHGGMVSSHVSYLGGLGVKSRLGDWPND